MLVGMAAAAAAAAATAPTMPFCRFIVYLHRGCTRDRPRVVIEML